MYSIINIENGSYWVAGNGRCLHEIASMYSNMPDKVVPYNDKLMIKVKNIHNFPLKQWSDYYLTIVDECIMMYHTEGQYVAPYYKNNIEPVDESVWRKMYKKYNTNYHNNSNTMNLAQQRYTYENVESMEPFNIPILPDEIEEPIPVYKSEIEYKTPEPSDIEEEIPYELPLEYTTEEDNSDEE